MSFTFKPFEKLSKNIGNYLKAGSTYSSIRLMCVMTVFTGNLSIFSIVLAGVVTVIREKTFDFVGAAALVTAIGVIIGVALWGKNAGKSIETAEPHQTDPSASV